MHKPYKIRMILSLTILAGTSSLEQGCDQCIITTSLIGGRFGDQLSQLTATLYQAHITQIPFHYTPLSAEADQLEIAYIYPRFDTKPSYKPRIPIFNPSNQSNTSISPMPKPQTSNSSLINPQTGAHIIQILLTQKNHRPTLYMSHEASTTNQHKLYRKDPEFMALLRRALCPHIENIHKPHTQINYALPPLGDTILSVAVHVRVGSGESPADQQALQGKLHTPLADGSFWVASDRFLPYTYYIEQIKYLADLFPEKQLFVFLFTDHQNPPELCEQFKNVLNQKKVTNITITSREASLQNTPYHETGVLDDFFSLLKYECLIRSNSAFAIMADLLGTHKIAIHPLIRMQKLQPKVRLIGSWIDNRMTGVLSPAINLIS